MSTDQVSHLNRAHAGAQSPSLHRDSRFSWASNLAALPPHFVFVVLILGAEAIIPPARTLRPPDFFANGWYRSHWFDSSAASVTPRGGCARDDDYSQLEVFSQRGSSRPSRSIARPLRVESSGCSATWQ